MAGPPCFFYIVSPPFCCRRRLGRSTTSHKRLCCAPAVVSTVAECTTKPVCFPPQTLHGHGLGYVPRDQTFRLPQPVTFGRVESIGQEASTGNFGLTVRRL